MDIPAIKSNLKKALHYWDELYQTSTVKFTEEGPPGNRQPPGSVIPLSPQQQRWVLYGNYWETFSPLLPRYEKEVCEAVHKGLSNGDLWERVIMVARKRNCSTNSVLEYSNHALFTVAHKVIILTQGGN